MEIDDGSEKKGASDETYFFGCYHENSTSSLIDQVPE
jgi:hypothetical protein